MRIYQLTKSSNDRFVKEKRSLRRGVERCGQFYDNLLYTQALAAEGDEGVDIRISQMLIMTKDFSVKDMVFEGSQRRSYGYLGQ